MHTCPGTAGSHFELLRLPLGSLQRSPSPQPVKRGCFAHEEMEWEGKEELEGGVERKERGGEGEGRVGGVKMRGKRVTVVGW